MTREEMELVAGNVMSAVGYIWALGLAVNDAGWLALPPLFFAFGGTWIAGKAAGVGVRLASLKERDETPK